MQPEATLGQMWKEDRRICKKKEQEMKMKTGDESECGDKNIMEPGGNSAHQARTVKEIQRTVKAISGHSHKKRLVFQ